MEPKTRNIVIVVAVLCLIACCCVLTVGGALAGNWLIRTRELGVDWEREWRAGEQPGAVSPQRFSQTFVVGDTPTIDVENFAGKITVRAGEAGTIQVLAEKKAQTAPRLDAIQIQMDQKDDTVTVKSRVSSPSLSNVSVDLEITVPANSQVTLRTGAGEVTLTGIQRTLDVSTGAGTVRVRDAQGPARIETGAGTIDYDGLPTGESRMHTGAGSISIALPREANLQIDLNTGLGRIDTQIDVDGQVSPTKVSGLIGTGADGALTANTGVGAISIRYR
jgi:hypothetical protein